MNRARLTPDSLRHRCDPAALGFETTADVEPLGAMVGQPRALRALELALSMPAPGYNVFATGPAGTGRRTAVEAQLRERAATRPTPPDHVYVFNFDVPENPRAVGLPPGRGRRLAREMETFVHEARRQVPLAFESGSYIERHRRIHAELERRRDEVLAPLHEEAKRRGIAVELTPAGFVSVPIVGGRPTTPEEFQRLPEAIRDRYMQALEELRDRMGEIVARLRDVDRAGRDEHQALDREVGEFAVGHLVEELKARWEESEEVIAWLDQVREDVIDHLAEFRAEEPGPDALAAVMTTMRRTFFRRYAVNVFISHDEDGGAPVVVDPLGGYYDLFGRIEYQTEMGAVATDHLHLRPGALHRANGGYLVLQATAVLGQPFVWERLKEALRRERVRIENLGAQLTLFPTATVEPEEIPLDVKVVLIGPTRLYRLLFELDDDVRGLFKVRADFDFEMPRDADGVQHYARFVSRQVADGSLPPFGADAVARLVEHGSRLAGHRDRLTTRFARIADTVVEAGAWAARDGEDTVRAAHVQRAVDEREYRSNLIEERVREAMREGTLRIELDGETVGQVNGLAVVALGDHAFGHPARISATASAGDGRVIDIDREVELSGPIHDKGFLILEGFLQGGFSTARPLSLRASIVFEQSYEPVEGDSASGAELCALLSALAGAPVRQSVAVTGAVDQHGRIQAVGGLNEKIEGFFDLVRTADTLDGRHGVVVPAANLPHLMLREDVVAACEEGLFSVWAVDSVEDALGVLTGREAGRRAADGGYPEGTLFAAVQRRLDELADAARHHHGGDGRSP